MTDTHDQHAPTESTLAKIRRLLAKAEGTNYAEEAETYRDAAFRLMAKYAIADVTELGADPDDQALGRHDVDISNPYGDARSHLLGCVARPLGCYVTIWTYKRSRTPHRATIHGRAADRDRVELLYTSLLLQATRQVTRVRPRLTPRQRATYTEGQVRRATQTARMSWLHGYAAAVQERLESMVVEESNGSGAELVLADRMAVAQRYALSGGDVGEAKDLPKVDRGAAAAGARAGRLADLGGGKLAGTPARRRVGA